MADGAHRAQAVEPEGSGLAQDRPASVGRLRMGQFRVSAASMPTSTRATVPVLPFRRYVAPRPTSGPCSSTASNSTCSPMMVWPLRMGRAVHSARKRTSGAARPPLASTTISSTRCSSSASVHCTTSAWPVRPARATTPAGPPGLQRVGVGLRPVGPGGARRWLPGTGPA